MNSRWSRAPRCLLACRVRSTSTRKASAVLCALLLSAAITIGRAGAQSNAIIRLSAGQVGFGTQLLGPNRESRIIMLTNSGAVTVTISGSTLSGAAPGDFAIAAD